MEEVPNTPEGFETQAVSWDELGSGKRRSESYLEVEPDKAYQIVIKTAQLKRDSIYKDKHGNPKLKVVLTLSNVNNEEVKDLQWETGSWTIIKALNEARKEGKLVSTVWLLKKKRENERISYVFEAVGETSPSHSSSDNVGSYLGETK